jgi:hypothetical protein
MKPRKVGFLHENSAVTSWRTAGIPAINMRPEFYPTPMKIERIEIPIATGERLVTQHAFREVLEKRACSVLQPDIIHCGGLSEARRIAATPFSPPSGPTQGLFQGPPVESKLLAVNY